MLNRKPYPVFGVQFGMRFVLAALILASPLFAEEPRPLVTLPLTVTTNGIYIPASINGKAKVLFQLDSAAGWHAINWKLADQMNLRLREHASGAEGAGDGRTRASEVLDARLFLSSFELPFSPAAAIDLDPVADLKGNDLNGLLGAPLFKRYIVETDIDAGLFRLYDPATWQYRGRTQPLPLRVDDMGVPRMKVSFLIGDGPPVEGEFIIDSAAGATTLYLSAPFASQKKILETIRGTGGKLLADEVSGVGGSSKLWLARIEQARIGTAVFSHPVIGITEAKGGTFAQTDIAGIVGGGFLHRFKVIYDCPHRRIYLEPTARVHEAFEEDMSGLEWINVGEGRREFRVHAISPDSPAAHTAVQPGDILVSVDGRPAKEFDRSSLCSYLRHPGRKVQFKFQRGDQAIEIDLVLARLI
jgi:hypothetical protein